MISMPKRDRSKREALAAMYSKAQQAGKQTTGKIVERRAQLSTASIVVVRTPRWASWVSHSSGSG